MRPQNSSKVDCSTEFGIVRFSRDGALPVRDLCFHASSLPCLHTFWRAILTSFYIHLLVCIVFWC